MSSTFHSIYSHGFIRAGVAVPPVAISDPQTNIERMTALAKAADEEGAAVCLFPELGITGYSNEDLFHQSALLDQTRSSLSDFLEKTGGFGSVFIVGAPLKQDDALYNCAVVIHEGSILGVVPKSYLPNYREYYEKRQFTVGRSVGRSEMELCGRTVPFGPDLIFEATNIDSFRLFVEICEDLWVPIPPSSRAALAGATVLANPSASNITIGKRDYRRLLCNAQSGRTLSVYLYAAAGSGESTTDLAWDGHGLISENGEILSETGRFETDPQIIYSDIDLDRLSQDRMRLTSFTDAVREFKEGDAGFRKIKFTFDRPGGSRPVETLRRNLHRFPYVPSEKSKRDERCEETYNLQVQGLYQRLNSTGIEKAVIGISGGLDSTQALLVTARTIDRLELPRTNILAYTMPGFATSRRTLENAHRLMEAMGVEINELDIRPSSRRMLEDIGHPYAEGEEQYDVTFENVQAGERTSHLFRLANMREALVVGTGDLSELALGWTTYGVGDHMSHYNVNVSVPKTLIQYLIRWEADTGRFGKETGQILKEILDTEISPELVPSRSGDETDTQPAQSTEEVVGPYELQDFNLYYISRYGYLPRKVAFMSYNAWRDKTEGQWPEPYPEEAKNEYPLSEIKKWLRVFLQRFFSESQFKRSALPNGPKVGSGGSLSPRSDWRAPSDSSARTWLDELEHNVPQK